MDKLKETVKIPKSYKKIYSFPEFYKALYWGMSNEEINLLLAGSAESVPMDQLVAVLFSQHYADTRGNPENRTWQRLVDVYGKSKAFIILGTSRTIMIGNIWGIAYSSFANRLKRKPSGKTSLFYELGIMLSIIPLLPTALIHAGISRMRGKDIITFLNIQN